MRQQLVILLLLLLLAAGCATAYTSKSQRHYQVYSNVSMNQLGYWKGTRIHVPKGALLAVIADGAIWDTSSNRWGPTGFLRIKVGEHGPLRSLFRYYDSAHVRVFKSMDDGELHYEIKPKSFQSAANLRAKITATVIIWQKENLKEVYSDIGDLISAHHGNKEYEALLFSLAMCYIHIGEYSKSEVVLGSLRDSSGRQGRDAAMAFLYSSENEKWLGRYGRMKTYAEEALEIGRREGYKGIEGQALILMSEALAYSGEFERAVELSIQSLQLSKGMRFHSSNIAARAHMNLGILYLRFNRASDSLSHCQKAIEFLDSPGAWVLLAQSYDLLGHAQQRLDMREAAKKSYESAIKVGDSIGRAETLWSAHSGLGQIAASEGNEEKAFEHYAEAIKVIEAMRAGIDEPNMRSEFIADKLQVYEWMIKLLLNMKRDKEAFNYLERARSRLTLDMLQQKIFTSRDKQVNELLTKARSLREQLHEMGSARGEVSFRENEEADYENEGLEALSKDRNQEVKRLQMELESVIGRINEINPDLASLLTVNPLTVGEIQALLGNETTLLSYFIGSEINIVFVVSEEKVKVHRFNVPRDKIIEVVQDVRAQTAEGVPLKMLTSKEYEKPLSDSYDILIRPAEGDITAKRHLVIVPYGILHYLPFHASRNPSGKYLMESNTVSYLPSATVLKYARLKNRGNRVDLMAVANPVTDLTPLPGAEVEAREVSALFEKRLVLTGSKATETLLKAEGPMHDLLLLSTHGEMIESDPLKSNLRFTASPQDDGKLTVNEIFDMEVKANLVTLSACETGLVRGPTGGLPRGDDLVGLSRAFIHAGAPTVVASLWRVSDDSTAALMRSFYRNLATMSKADALRQSQLELLKSSTETYSHPFFWAPFILVGDWN